MPRQFHFAKQFQIVDPIKHLYDALKKITDNDKKEDFKNNVFTQFIMIEGDKTRYLRKIQKIASNATMLDEYLNNTNEAMESVAEVICDNTDMSVNVINELRGNEEITNSFVKNTEKYVERIDSETTRNLPLKYVEKAYDSIDTIDKNIISKLTIDQKTDIDEKLDELIQKLNELKEVINVQ